MEPKINFENLRNKAEEKFNISKEELEKLEKTDLQKLIHELQVHKIELEIQNEELKKTQIDLERSYFQFFYLFHKAPIGYVVLDEFGIIIQVNDTFCEQLKTTADKLKDKPFSNLIYGPDRDLFLLRYKALFKQPVGKSFEVFIAFEHVQFYARLEASIIQFLVGKLEYSDKKHLLVTISDITEQKIAENKLIESQKLYESLVNTMPFYVYRVDTEGRLTFLNDQLLKELGKTLDECIGLSAYDFYPPELAQKYHSDNEKVIKTGETLYLVEENPEPNSNEKRYVEVFKIPIRDVNNRIIGIQGVYRDITPRIRMQNTLKENEEKLKELNAQKDKFFSIIAHDLRKPFHNLMGVLDLLSTEFYTIEDEKKINLINLLLKQSRSVYSFLENLLNWSRTQLNKISFEIEKLNIDEELRNIIDLFEPDLFSKKIRIEVINSDNKFISFDKNVFNIIFRNLISNAIKFSYHNSEIKIEVKKYDDSFLEFIVADNGVGIDQEHIDYLFRLDKNFTSAGTDKETGTGLGLILCKELIEKLNGKIWIESEKDKGTKVHLTIPI